MIISDYHIHTDFSTDSTARPRQQIEALIAAGIREICITDHHDIGYPNNEFRIDPYRYFETMLQLSKEYAGRADISIGIELGLRHDYHHSIEDFADAFSWDFIIGSSHVVDGLDPYYPDYWKDKTVSDGILRYYESIIENINTFSCFNVYGHLDYVVRYAPDFRNSYNLNTYSDIIDEILRLLISKGKGIECNTAGYKYGLDHPNPEEAILRRYRELGGEILTIGSDAHKPEHAAYDFNRLPEVLKSCGFRYYTVFHGQKPVMLPLD